MFFFLQRSKPKTISSHSHKNLDSNEDRKKVGRVVETKILILDSRIDRIVNRSNSLPNSKLTIILQRLPELKLRRIRSVPGDEKVRSDGRELWISARRGERDFFEEERREEKFVAWEVGPGRDVVPRMRERVVSLTAS